MTLTAFSSRAAAALVAAVAGFASYQHIYRVASGAGEHQSVAAVMPLAIDGLILVATLAMLDDKRNRRRPRLSARVALVFGVLATLAANIASAHPTVTARLVAAVPAVSFLLAVEVLARTGRKLDDPAPVVVEHVDQAAAVEPVADPWEYAEPVAVDPAPVTPPAAPVDAKPAVTRTRPKTLTSAAKVAKAAGKLPAGTVAEIAAKAGVSESTARRHLPAVKPAPVASPSVPHAAETAINGAALV